MTPNNREAKVRFDRCDKLLTGAMQEFNKFAEFTTKVEEEMRVDFIIGESRSQQTESNEMVFNPEMHALKSKIQGLVDGSTK